MSKQYATEGLEAVLVPDNLNTHVISSRYEAFPPEKARRVAKRLEMSHTLKHGSWLDIAGIEINIMAAQCLAGASIP